MKAAALAAGGDQTAQTRVFDIVRGAPWPAIYPGRALRNEFSAAWHGREELLETQQAEQEKAYLALLPALGLLRLPESNSAAVSGYHVPTRRQDFRHRVVYDAGKGFATKRARKEREERK